MLTRVATDDVECRSPQTISDRLRSTGLVLLGVPGSVVARDLVMPVLRTVRKGGVPWEQWWDVYGLHALLIELWAGRRLSTHPPEKVRDELKAVWCLEDDRVVDAVLDNTEDPFTFLPTDLLHESATGTARGCTQFLVTRGLMKITLPDAFLSTRPGLADRPELTEVLNRWYHRVDLEETVQRVRGLSPDLLMGLRRDFEAWDARMGQLASHLTAQEVKLFTPMTEDERYGEECLRAGWGLHRAELDPDDALLWQPDSGARDSSVPDWAAEEIITCGTRFFHRQAGPHPVWLATVETDAHMAAVRMLMEPPTRHGFEVEDYDDGLRLWFQFPAHPADPAPPFQAPYTYSLSWVEHALELLHLATVGYARLSVVRLVGDGELRAVGSIRLGLPEEVCARAKEASIAALRRLVGDETQTIRQRIALEGRDQAAEVAFQTCETAKGEDIHDELALESDAPEYQSFIAAARHLAWLRSRYAADLLDGKGPLEGDTELKAAAEDRQRVLELLRAATGRGKGKPRWTDRSDRPSVDEQSAFVHLINRYGTLQLAVCRTSAGHSHFDLITCDGFPLVPLAGAVDEWRRQAPDHPQRKWHDYLEHLVTECGGPAQAIIETVTPHEVRRLVLSPTAPLELLPLHAAPLGSARTPTLIDAFEQVVYAPTARLVSAIESSQRQAAVVEVLVVAHGGGHLPGLELIGGPLCEAHVIEGLHDSVEVVMEEEATPARALHMMPMARIVHVAAHGLTHPNRWAAGLALHGGSLGKAMLTSSGILADGIFSSVDLVILNACRTGTHEGTGRTVQTLRSIESVFLARGAKAVISTLWDITDLQGVVFSAVLHAHLGAGLDSHSAYADTIRYLREYRWHVPSGAGPAGAAESAIDTILPDWRSHLDQQVAENPLFWAAFKITGVV
ncbi:CHAT domain-containing protein [Streptomyces coelicoflavus]|uniref:CHAT domain-containing protein n=1 Tax=Streptomyces coelicoflavus TaxID=285562 RepID=UPI00131F3E9B|nr:CHAT domain-containing protein [Streptomyces coelicoflavus]